MKQYEDDYYSNENKRIILLRLQNKVREIQTKIGDLNSEISEISSKHENMIIESVNARSEVSNTVALIHDL